MALTTITHRQKQAYNFHLISPYTRYNRFCEVKVLIMKALLKSSDRISCLEQSMSPASKTLVEIGPNL